MLPICFLKSKSDCIQWGLLWKMCTRVLYCLSGLNFPPTNNGNLTNLKWRGVTRERRCRSNNNTARMRVRLSVNGRSYSSSRLWRNRDRKLLESWWAPMFRPCFSFGTASERYLKKTSPWPGGMLCRDKLGKFFFKRCSFVHLAWIMYY